jgi:hypothetical protein
MSRPINAIEDGNVPGDFEIAGDLIVKDETGAVRARLESTSAGLTLHGPDGKERVLLGGKAAELKLTNGALIVLDAAGKAMFSLRNQAARSQLTLGNAGNPGRLILFDRSGNPRAELRAEDDELVIRDAAGKGVIAFQTQGGRGHLGLGNTNTPGRLMIFDKAGKLRMQLRGEDDELVINDAAGKGVIAFQTQGGRAHLGLGNTGMPGRLMLFDNAGKQSIELAGDTGDILLAGADCAEEFGVREGAAAAPGTVMVAGPTGVLDCSHEAYDRRVVGVVSGAGAYQPGIVLDKRPQAGRREPIAMVGKVACQVTADAEPISVGDLLTTSDVPGHAMKAKDPSRAFGAVLGKALGDLRAGRGLVPVLVALQ